MAKLCLRFGDSILKEHVLSQTVTTIGRRVDRAFESDDRTVASQHAKVGWNEGQYVIEALGSLAGT